MFWRPQRDSNLGFSVISDNLPLPKRIPICPYRFIMLVGLSIAAVALLPSSLSTQAMQQQQHATPSFRRVAGVTMTGSAALTSVTTPLSLQRARSVAQRLEERRAQSAPTMPEMRASLAAIFDADISTAIPVVLVLLLALSNLFQIGEVMQQVAYLDATSAYGDEFSKLIVDDVIGGSEFTSGLYDVIGQSLGEIFLAPMLVRLFELVLDVALARTVGRRLIPMLIVTEAFGEVVGELAGQSFGSAAADTLHPFSDMCLHMLGVFGS